MGVPKEKPRPIAGLILSSGIDDGPSFTKLEVFFGVIVVIVLAVLFLYITTFQQRTACQQSAQSQACIDERFDACMATEKYTRQECIDLLGSK